MFISAGVLVNRQSSRADGKTAGLCAFERVNEVVTALDCELYRFDCRLQRSCRVACRQSQFRVAAVLTVTVTVIMPKTARSHHQLP